MAGVKAEGAAVADKNVNSVHGIPRVSRVLYDQQIAKEVGSRSLLSVALEKGDDQDKPSQQGVSLGRKGHPFNFEMVASFQNANVHHGRSVHAKVAAIVGLGFQTPNDKKRADAKLTGIPLTPEDLPPEDDVSRIDMIMDPLCQHSWQDAINDACEDFVQTGNGYLEIVRDKAGVVAGCHHLPSKEVFVVIEDAKYNMHYSIQGAEDGTGSRVFAKFGDKEKLIERSGGDGFVTFDSNGTVDPEFVSEVIHFRRPTSLSRWYGFPDWLSAVASIELVQCVTQHEYDFFLNRGVPEFMLFVLGQTLHKKDKERIETAMQSTIGLGNQHKSLLVNLSQGGADMKVQLEKLAMESKSDGSQFSGMSESLALQIVTAHGVPPLLAGIQVPGKLGASNEMVQAMQAFQVLVIEPMQRLFRQTLMRTLGSEGAGLTLGAGDLVLNTITGAIDIGTADTVARMRQSPQEAEAEGRDLDDGLKKGEEWTDEEKGALVGETIDLLIDRLRLRSSAA